MKKYYETKNFLALKKKWYDKLKRSGFEDEEWTSFRPGASDYAPYLKSTSGMLAYFDSKQWDDFELSGIADSDTFYHFQTCAQYADELKYKNKYERSMFKLYVEGVSYRKIQRELKRRYPKSRRTFSPAWTCHAIKRLVEQIRNLQTYESKDKSVADHMISNNSAVDIGLGLEVKSNKE